MGKPAEPFQARIKRLAAEHGLSVSKLSYLAYDPDVKGTNPDTFKSVMAGRRQVTPVLIEAISDVLGINPAEFPEYRLAMARHALDEREVGLDEALASLRAVEQGLLQPGPAETRLHEELRDGASDPRRPSSPSARRNPQAS